MIIHPVMNVRRDAAGHLEEILPAGSEHADGVITESVIHAEVDRQTDAAQLAQLEQHLLHVIAEVRATVEDWQPMRQQALQIADELQATPPPLDPDEVAEARALLGWLADGHFTFLGYRDYDLEQDERGQVSLTAVLGSGLGILRQATDERCTRRFDQHGAKNDSGDDRVSH